MAGLDHMYDARGFIQNYIEQKIRDLLEDPMNEYQDPNWVQAALLFDRIVVPCEWYGVEQMYILAQDIVTKANNHGNKWILQVIPGTYNEKVINPNSIDMENIPKGIEVREYDDNIDRIKKWMKSFEEDRLEFRKFIKR